MKKTKKMPKNDEMTKKWKKWWRNEEMRRSWKNEKNEKILTKDLFFRNFQDFQDFECFLMHACMQSWNLEILKFMLFYQEIMKIEQSNNKSKNNQIIK